MFEHKVGGIQADQAAHYAYTVKHVCELVRAECLNRQLGVTACDLIMQANLTVKTVS